MRDFFENIYLVIISLLATIAISYFSYELLQTLPKPETFIEFVKFYFKDPFGYFKIDLFCLLSAAASSIFIIGSWYYLDYDRELHIFFRIIIIVLCICAIANALYFLYYMIYLTLVLAAIAVVAWIVFSPNKRR